MSVPSGRAAARSPRSTFPDRRGAGILRSFATGARLGWAIEANWTDPFLFAVYSVAKPVGAALVLAGMGWVVTGSSRPDYLGFLFAGSACWTFVAGAILGLVGSVLDDRERYRMLKYVVTSPVRILPFLFGRAVAAVIGALAGCVVTLAVGIVLAGAPIDLGRTDWPLLAAVLVPGLVAIMMLGIAVAGFVLTLRREAWSYPATIAGALYLVSGTIFPIDLLPGALRTFALLLPTTWWLEGMRRALLGRPTAGVLATADNAHVLLALIASTAVLTLAAWGVFRFFDHRARELGLLDQTTGS